MAGSSTATDDVRNTKRIYQANLHQKGPKARGKDDEVNDIRKVGIVNWRREAQDRDGW